jgi:hypothetical protein
MAPYPLLAAIAYGGTLGTTLDHTRRFFETVGDSYVLRELRVSLASWQYPLDRLKRR